MKYRTIRRCDPVGYEKQLEKLSNEGFRVISAGMVLNTVKKCFEWWAILEEAQPLIEEKKKPEGEAAELLEAAKKIKEFCGKTECNNCSFVTCDGYCEFTENAPDAWGLEGRGVNV